MTRPALNFKRMSINGCARCDGEGHKDLVFREFVHPIEIAGEAPFTHFAFCPLRGEPIMLQTKSDPPE